MVQALAVVWPAALKAEADRTASGYTVLATKRSILGSIAAKNTQFILA
jgi:hypothetical protein